MAAQQDVVSWQDQQGAWPLKGSWWSSQHGTKAYATAFATLVLSVDGGRLSIFNRKPPKLPKTQDAKFDALGRRISRPADNGQD